MDLVTALELAPVILTECAISERLRRRTDIELHPTLFNTPLIYDETGRKRLEEIYSEYRDIALNARLPILLCAPTWRIDKERIKAAGFGLSLNQDALRFMIEFCEKRQHASSPLFIGGLIGPKNDCYSPQASPLRDAAAAYHSWQIDQLVEGGASVIVAQTIPSVQEGWGMADALSKAGIPYIISFVTNRNGRILDNTPLNEAIGIIDNGTATPPAGYMVNCVYPTFLCAENQPAGFFDRLIGIQANASSRDHDQLDGSEKLQQDPLSDWGGHMVELNKRYGVKILGGCCGTDNSYLSLLAKQCML
ncbi:MAG: homocysteine S-methyltransferase family protein [Desulforhopalus sp.]